MWKVEEIEKTSESYRVRKTTIPNEASQTYLSQNQFREASAQRYGLTSKNLPSPCDECDGQKNLIHARICKKGGLIKHGHDYHSEQCAAMEQMDWNNVGIEPIMKDADPSKTVQPCKQIFKLQ